MDIRRKAVYGTTSGLLAAMLAACSGAPAEQVRATTGPASNATASVATPTPITIPTAEVDLGVSGIGEVKAKQDADMVFAIQGTVAQVLVSEGDNVTKDQVLAILDTSLLDQQIKQAEAGVAQANAQKSSLSEGPRAADVAAARAQVAQAQAQLERALQGAKQPDRDLASSSLASAEAQLQNARNQLSLAKTNADAQVNQASERLVQAQAAYGKAKSDWDFVQETGKNPVQPDTVNAQGKKVANKVTDTQREAYYAAFIQSESALRQAEQAVEQAQVTAEEARKNEIIGIQTAEQGVNQAQANVDKVNLPPDKDAVAAARAAVAAAQANLSRLSPSPNGSQLNIADAGIAQAEAQLELARINRQKAELHAPFDGVVAIVNVDPGDPSTTQGPAIKIVDLSTLQADVQISDVDIGRVEEGQTVNVFADALPDTKITGKVSYIAPTATTTANIRSYLVRIDLEKVKGLRPGMSVRVEFPTKSSNATAAPASTATSATTTSATATGTLSNTDTLSDTAATATP